MHSFCRKLVIILTALVSLVTTAACTTLNEYISLDPLRVYNGSERLYREADRLLAANNKAEAILAFRQVYRIDPTYLPALRQLARTYADQGRRRLALYFYQKLVALNPADTKASQVLTEMPAIIANSVEVQTVWQTFIEEQAISGMVLGKDTLFVTTQGGTLAAISAQDGSIRWLQKFDKPILGSPAYSPDPDQPLVIVGCEDGILYATSASDGAQLWRFETEAPIYGAVVTSGSIVYAGSVNGTLYALRRDDGTMLWEYRTAGALHASPTVADGMVYIGSLDNTLYALDEQLGTLIWRFDANAVVETTPVIQGDLLFFGANNSRLYCLNRFTGQEVWRYSTGDAIYSSAVANGDVVYVASTRQALLAVLVGSGTLLWKYDTATFLTMRPEIDLQAGRLYLVANADPLLYCVEADSGKLLWQFDTGDWPSTPPLLRQRTLFLGGRDGTVSAYTVN